MRPRLLIGCGAIKLVQRRLRQKAGTALIARMPRDHVVDALDQHLRQGDVDLVAFTQVGGVISTSTAAQTQPAYSGSDK